MKKSFKVMLAVAMLFSATLSANAQFSKKENNRVPDRFHMGIRGGVTFNSYSEGEDGLTFPYGGFNMDFQIAPIPLFLETGMYYMNKGFTYEYYGYRYSEEESIDDHYINMPILVSYHINLAPNLFLQPFVGGVGGYLTESESFEAAVRAGVGINFGRLYMNVGYDFGVTGHGYNDGTNNTLFATIGFNWAGSR